MLSLTAQLGDIAALVVTVYWMKYGFGVHIWNLTLTKLLAYSRVGSCCNRYQVPYLTIYIG